MTFNLKYFGLACTIAVVIGGNILVAAETSQLSGGSGDDSKGRNQESKIEVALDPVGKLDEDPKDLENLMGNEDLDDWMVNEGLELNAMVDEYAILNVEERSALPCGPIDLSRCFVTLSAQFCGRCSQNPGPNCLNRCHQQAVDSCNSRPPYANYDTSWRKPDNCPGWRCLACCNFYESCLTGLICGDILCNGNTIFEPNDHSYNNQCWANRRSVGSCPQFYRT